MPATQHFIERAKERMGYPAALACELAEELVAAIRAERWDIAHFVARVNREGLRLFRFRDRDQRVFYALIDTNAMTCITIMPPGFKVRREKKGIVMLKESDV